jgi:hypothetical protein
MVAYPAPSIKALRLLHLHNGLDVLAGGWSGTWQKHQQVSSSTPLPSAMIAAWVRFATPSFFRRAVV